MSRHPPPAVSAAAAVAAVRTCSLGKRFGTTWAVDALDLDIPAGQFFGLLGPNGSGKTTTLHMLATLIRPSAGTAEVAGLDVRAQPLAVRRALGLVFQESALDRQLTVAENLAFAGALHGLPRRLVRARADELLALFDLATRRATPVAQLSGGMRRALDIARGLLHHPQVVLLDEPTIGLDLINRRAIWAYLMRLRGELGITLLLTTHYLQEAEACDRVAFLRTGRLVGSGTPRELIGALARYILEIQPSDAQADAPIRALLEPRHGAPVAEATGRLLFRIADPEVTLDRLRHELGDRAAALSLRAPTLEDVYLWIHCTDHRQ